MKTWLTMTSIFLTGTAMAAESLQDCTIKAVRERVLAEQSGGPQRATEEGEPALSASGPAVFEVVAVSPLRCLPRSRHWLLSGDSS